MKLDNRNVSALTLCFEGPYYLILVLIHHSPQSNGLRILLLSRWRNECYYWALWCKRSVW